MYLNFRHFAQTSMIDISHNSPRDSTPHIAQLVAQAVSLSPATITKHYLKGWFAPDLISLVPLDLIGIVLGNHRLYLSLRLLRLVRMTHLFEYVDVIENWYEEANKTKLEISVHLIIWFFIMTVFSSIWVTCLWFMIGSEAYGTFAGDYIFATKASLGGMTNSSNQTPEGLMPTDTMISFIKFDKVLGKGASMTSKY